MKFYKIFLIFILTNPSLIANEAVIRQADQMPTVKVKAGEFFFGSDEPMHYDFEKPIMTVKMKEFYMDKYEVSNQQYNLCIQNKKCKDTKKTKDLTLPVQKVTWKNAQNYCEFVGGSLPSEAQWEYAAKGDLSLSFPWGNSLVDQKSKTLITDNIKTPGSVSGLIPTTKASALNTDSPFGVSHLAGNISEWTLDDAILTESMQLKPREYTKKELKKRRASDYLFLGQSKYKVVKGSSFQTAFPLFQRSSFKTFYPKENSSLELGFRCVSKSK
ncbi:MAG: SUMF1/EgtB/PvdO family nonheme iron enzyme [Candidatus Cloacimonetes bacterium]|nr:SUMF1/EgtB/PvdO family nonheme iron enzyme [Candidatus Cloacimonadota bacterium]